MNLYRFLHQFVTRHFPPDEYVRLGWWMLSMPILLFILLRAPFYIAKEWEGSKSRAIRATLLFVAIWLGADVAYYVQAAYLRATPQECSVKRRSPHGPYEALICYTGGNAKDADTEGFVRLLSTETGAVLAERDFYNPEFGRVYWAPDRLSVGLADGSAEFHLPPTRWDWLRAKLP